MPSPAARVARSPVRCANWREVHRSTACAALPSSGARKRHSSLAHAASSSSTRCDDIVRCHIMKVSGPKKQDTHACSQVTPRRPCRLGTGAKVSPLAGGMPSASASRAGMPVVRVKRRADQRGAPSVSLLTKSQWARAALARSAEDRCRANAGRCLSLIPLASIDPNNGRMPSVVPFCSLSCCLTAHAPRSRPSAHTLGVNSHTQCHARAL